MSVGYECTLKAGGKIVGKARDVDLSGAADKVDTSTRDCGGWKAVRQGLKEFSSSIDQLWVPSNEAQQILINAWFSGVGLECEWLDENGNGYSGTVIVGDIKFGQPLSGAVSIPITLWGTGALTPVVAGS